MIKYLYMSISRVIFNFICDKFKYLNIFAYTANVVKAEKINDNHYQTGYHTIKLFLLLICNITNM